MKNKGFTLIELLAVIVVLGIIMLIAITSVSNVIVNSRLNGFELSRQMLEKAASTYINTNNINVGTGSTLEVTYNTLKTNGFINKVSDPKSNSECTNSRVYVRNVSGSYTYTGALVCDNYMDINAYNLVTNSDFSNGTTGWNVNNNVTVDQSIYTSKSKSLKFTGTNNITYVKQSLTNISGHQYYISGWCNITSSTENVPFVDIRNTDSTNQTRIYADRLKTDQWQLISTIDSNHNGFSILIGSANTQITGVLYGDDINVIDLTAIYGAGNEPTLNQINNIVNNMRK